MTIKTHLARGFYFALCVRVRLHPCAEVSRELDFSCETLSPSFFGEAE